MLYEFIVRQLVGNGLKKIYNDLFMHLEIGKALNLVYLWHHVTIRVCRLNVIKNGSN